MSAPFLSRIRDPTPLPLALVIFASAFVLLTGTPVFLLANPAPSFSLSLARLAKKARLYCCENGARLSPRLRASRTIEVSLKSPDLKRGETVVASLRLSSCDEKNQQPPTRSRNRASSPSIDALADRSFFFEATRSLARGFPPTKRRFYSPHFIVRRAC